MTVTRQYTVCKFLLPQIIVVNYFILNKALEVLDASQRKWALIPLMLTFGLNNIYFHTYSEQFLQLYKTFRIVRYMYANKYFYNKSLMHVVYMSSENVSLFMFQTSRTGT